MPGPQDIMANQIRTGLHIAMQVVKSDTITGIILTLLKFIFIINKL